MLEQPKIIIISKFYQTHVKISKPTGATAPVEKVKEISSIMSQIIGILSQTIESYCTWVKKNIQFGEIILYTDSGLWI